jgi:hypothetical protein
MKLYRSRINFVLMGVTAYWLLLNIKQTIELIRIMSADLQFPLKTETKLVSLNMSKSIFERNSNISLLFPFEIRFVPSQIE